MEVEKHTQYTCRIYDFVFLWQNYIYKAAKHKAQIRWGEGHAFRIDRGISRRPKIFCIQTTNAHMKYAHIVPFQFSVKIQRLEQQVGCDDSGRSTAKQKQITAFVYSRSCPHIHSHTHTHFLCVHGASAPVSGCRSLGDNERMIDEQREQKTGETVCCRFLNNVKV